MADQDVVVIRSLPVRPAEPVLAVVDGVDRHAMLDHWQQLDDGTWRGLVRWSEGPGLQHLSWASQIDRADVL